MVSVDGDGESLHKVDIVGCAWGTVGEESTRFLLACQGAATVFKENIMEDHAIAPLIVVIPFVPES